MQKIIIQWTNPNNLNDGESIHPNNLDWVYNNLFEIKREGSYFHLYMSLKQVFKHDSLDRTKQRADELLVSMVRHLTETINKIDNIENFYESKNWA